MLKHHRREINPDHPHVSWQPECGSREEGGGAVAAPHFEKATRIARRQIEVRQHTTSDPAQVALPEAELSGEAIPRFSGRLQLRLLLRILGGDARATRTFCAGSQGQLFRV